MIRCKAETGSLAVGLALLFDLDGVIVDSNRVHSKAWREYLRRCGREAPEGFDVRMFGKRNDDIVRDVFGWDLEPAEVLRHGAEKEKLYREMMSPVLRAHLVPGVASFLERHWDMPMAVASNAEAANVDFVLGGSGLRRFFRAVVDGAQVERPKPDPEIYFRAAALLDVPPVKCIIFEDSKAGIQAARAARARVVAVNAAEPASELPQVEMCVRDFFDPGLEQWLSELDSVR
jgi:HAD superfamily hydrolase (TIGR01509 family)